MHEAEKELHLVCQLLHRVDREIFFFYVLNKAVMSEYIRNRLLKQKQFIFA